MISKKSKVILILCVFAFVFVSALASYTAYAVYALKTEPITYKSQIYSVKSGFTQATVIDDFAPNLVAKYIYKIYFKFNPQFTAIQKGDYFVGGKKTLLELLHDMVQGNVVIKKYPTFTIAEGTNLMRILNSISKRSLKDDKFSLLMATPYKFMQEALKEHQDLLSFIDGPYENLEGFIAPATYPMYEKEPYFKMFKVGLIKQLQYLKQAWDKRAKNEEIKTPYQALILASLIEKETSLDSERKLVSAVFLNRLRLKMRLQTDPTVMYGINKVFVGKLTRRHLKTDHAYNTYTRAGLPPSPICMPSKPSIEAALSPEKSKALYFVAKSYSPKDGHVFTNSLQEHNKAVKEYRKSVKQYLAKLKKANQDAKDTKASTQANNKAQAKTTDPNKADNNNITEADIDTAIVTENDEDVISITVDP